MFLPITNDVQHLFSIVDDGHFMQTVICFNTVFIIVMIVVVVLSV